MKIQIGEIYMDKVTEQKVTYPNKTRKYLLPCLKEYGEDLINRINNVFKVAVGIGDIIVNNCGYKHEKHIFILLDSVIASKYFKNFLEWIREQSMYQDDYVFDNIQKSQYHMIVLKLPEKFYDAFETFKLGNYSQMYDQDTIDKFFSNYPKVKRVFIKDHEYKLYFVKKINRIFGSSLTENDWHGELDFPPTEKTEIFNHYLKR